MVARGREARPLGAPGHCGRSPRPPLFRFRSVAEVWLGCPPKVSPARPATRPRAPKPPSRRSWGAAGGTEAGRSRRATAGVGRGRAASHPAWLESRLTCLARATLGAGLESSPAPAWGASLGSGPKVAAFALSSTRAKDQSAMPRSVSCSARRQRTKRPGSISRSSGVSPLHSGWA